VSSTAKHFLLAFGIALVGYVLCYQGIEHWREHKGPWQVSFIQGPDGTAPSIEIQQPALGITNVQIAFAEPIPPSTNSAAVTADRPVRTTISFRQPKPVPYDLPFGQCVFMDTISLPGTVTFKIFGHQIELLPRVVIIDRREYPWQAHAKITLPKS
jgi:hypothetical protein